MNRPIGTRRSNAAWQTAALVAALAFTLALPPVPARGCPFCRAVTQTLADRMDLADVVVIATPVPLAPGDDPEKTREQKFRAVEVLKGREHLPASGLFPAPLLDEPYKDGAKYLVLGAEPPDIFWDVPRPVSDRAVEYIRKLPEVSRDPAVRLVYFRDLLEDEDPFIAMDAYDEFAKAPYEDVKAIQEQLRHNELRERLADPELPMHLRRLYLVMLGICGGPDDAELLERLMDRELARDQQGPLALDATIACYLTLTGEAGLAEIERRFLEGEIKPSAAYATVVALRFHGEQEQRFTRERLGAAMRRLLEHPKLADMVIADLARWEDWSVIDRLVELFRGAEQTTENPHFLRVPVVKYLKACPLPEAKQHLAELEKIDPQAVRAASVLPFFAADDGAAEDGAAEDGAAEDGAAEDGAADDGAAEDGGDETENQPEDVPDPATEPAPTPAASPAAPQNNPRDARRRAQPKRAVEPLLVGGVTFGAALLLGGLMLVILGVIRFGPQQRAPEDASQ